MGAAFTFRAGAGFPGEVSRQENSIIEPFVINASTPPLLYGIAMIVDTTTGISRPYAAGDTAITTPFGVLVRPFPSSQASATNFGNTPLGGAGVPPSSGPASLLVSGYIIVQVPVGSTAAVKNWPVFVWAAATSGVHIQGGFETAASGGNTAALSTSLCHFNGQQDANGLIELSFNV